MPTEKKLVTKPIELATAQVYFSLFEDRGCLPLFNNITGGVIHAEKLKTWSKASNFNGVFFWYCWQDGQISLVAEYKPGFVYEEDKIESYWPDISNQLIESTNLITSSGEKIWYPFRSEAEFRVDVLKATNPESESVGVIGEKVSDFLSQMKDKNLCKVGFAYMDNEDGIKGEQPFFSAFLGREDLVYISYHFGYQESENEHHLKLVLIGRDADGMPLTNSKISPSQTFEILNGTRPPKKPGSTR